jgi:hypothetical protein
MMQENRLPEINIDGDLFVIDLEKHELRQDRYGIDNRISFREMVSVTNGFEFLYNPVNRGVFIGNEHQRYWEANSVCKVCLNPLLYIPELGFYKTTT